jgi:hypothetical protein
LYLCDEAPDFELPLTDDAFDHMRGEWLADEEAQRQYAEWSASVADQPLGVPCPGSSFVPF